MQSYTYFKLKHPNLTLSDEFTEDNNITTKLQFQELSEKLNFKRYTAETKKSFKIPSQNLFQNKPSNKINIKYIESNEDNTHFLIMAEYEIKSLLHEIEDDKEYTLYLYDILRESMMVIPSEKKTYFEQAVFSNVLNDTIITLNQKPAQNGFKSFIISLFTLNDSEVGFHCVDRVEYAESTGSHHSLLNLYLSNHAVFVFSLQSQNDTNFKFNIKSFRYNKFSNELNLENEDFNFDLELQNTKITHNPFCSHGQNGLFQVPWNIQFYSGMEEGKEACIMFVLNRHSSELIAYLTENGANGMASQKCDLIGLNNLEKGQFNLWHLISLYSPISKVNEIHNVKNHQFTIWKLPDALSIDIQSRKVTFFELMPKRTLQSSDSDEIITVFDDSSLALWKQHSILDNALEMLYNVQMTDFVNISHIVSDLHFLAIQGKKDENSVISVFDVFHGKFIMDIYNDDELCLLNMEKRVIFTKSKLGLHEMAFLKESDIWCLSYTGPEYVSFLKFSPYGKYVIFKQYKNENNTKYEYFGYLKYGSKEVAHCIEDSHIKNLDISEDEKSLIVIYRDRIKIRHIDGNQEEIHALNLLDLKLDKSEINTNGHINIKNSNNHNKITHLDKDNNLILILNNIENNEISILTFDVTNITKKSVYAIAISIELTLPNVSNRHENGFKWTSVIWNFSLDNSKIFFYFMNNLDSVLLVANIKNPYEISSTSVYFNFTLIRDFPDSHDNKYTDFLFSETSNRELIVYGKNGNVYALNDKLDNSEIDEIIESENVNNCQLKYSKFDDYIYVLEHNHQNDEITIKKTHYTKIMRKIQNDKKSELKLHLKLPSNKYNNEGHGIYKEGILISENSSQMAYFNFQSSDGFDYKSSLIWWHPKSMIKDTIYDYDIIKTLKGTRITFKDIESNIKKEVINRVNERNFSLIMSLVNDQNPELLELVLNKAFKDNIKVYYSALDKFSNIENDHYFSDVIKLCLDNNDIPCLNILINYMKKEIIPVDEIRFIIDRYNDDVLVLSQDLFINMIKIKIKKKSKIKLHKSYFKDIIYRCATSDEMTSSKVFEEDFRLISNLIGRNNTICTSDIVEVVKRLSRKIKKNEKLIGDLNVYAFGTENRMSNQEIMHRFNFLEIESYVYPWENAAKIGEKGLIYAILENKLEWKTFDDVTIQKLIDYKWITYGRYYLITNLVIHMVLIISYAIFCSKRQDNHIYLLISILISIYGIITELFEIWYFINNRKKNIVNKLISGLIRYLYDSYWNIVEFSIYILILSDIPCLIPGLDSDFGFSVSIRAFTICLLIWKSLFFLLPFRITGSLILMIFEIFLDVRSLILVLIFVLSGFSIAFHTLFLNDSKNNLDSTIQDIGNGLNFDSFGKSFTTTFGMMLGEFDVEYFYNSNSSIAAILLFMAYMIVMMVVLINLLIAVMGDSFDRIKAQEEISFYVAKAKVIQDVESKFPIINRIIKFIHKFLHVFYPLSHEYNKPKWLGRLKEIEIKVKESNKVMLKSLKDEISKLSEKIDAQIQGINNTIEQKMNIVLGINTKEDD